MKILSLALNNFRQFYGQQEAEFASGDTEQNITVFHGYNGAGKTALLNAFVWCLYGAAPDLENADRLENERAVGEAPVGSEIRVSVCLRFEVHGETWRVERSRTSVKTGTGTIQRKADTLGLQRVRTNGELDDINPESSRQTRIEQILPKTLYPFFFFNGERVERLAGADAYDAVESGIKTLLDIAVYERGAAHLRSGVSNEFSTELKAFGSAELKQALEEKEEFQRHEEEAKQGLDVHLANVRAVTAEIEEIERKQGEIREVHDLTKQRERVRADQKRVQEQVGSAKAELATEISRNGFLAFASRALDGTNELILAARKKGDIPAKIKPQFVDDLLTNARCICGEEIKPGSTHEANLRQWRMSTGLADLEERITHVGAYVSRMRERRGELFKRADTQFAKLSSLGTELRNLNEELSVLEEKIGDRSLSEDAALLQDTLKAKMREREHQNASIIVAKASLAQIQQGLEAVQKRIEKLHVEGDKATLVKRQLQAALHVADALERIASIQKEDVREALDEQIGIIWRDAAIKDYVATVTADYKLLLTKLVDGQRQQVHGASTGEKQVLALSFVAALVRKAKENVGKVQGGTVETGGYYPIVMDSPFGALEDDYRAKVAHWLPKLTHQVVVMVSKTQWREEVETAMRPRIGREYVLELHTQKDKSDRYIDVNGQSVPYVVSTTDATEMTMIRRV